jgi:four helix bundle protein
MLLCRLREGGLSMSDEVTLKGKDNNDNLDEELLFDFEKFDLYQRALEFSNKIFDIIKKYPKEERYILSSQLNRASSSIVLNLAEGFSRYDKKDKRKFYRISRGSAYECVPCLRLSLARNYINPMEFHDLYHVCHELSKRLSGLIRLLNN